MAETFATLKFFPAKNKSFKKSYYPIYSDSLVRELLKLFNGAHNILLVYDSIFYINVYQSGNKIKRIT